MSQFGRNNPYSPNSGSGGGYLPVSPFGGSRGSGSPGGSGFGERSDASHSLRPATIGQLCRATQAHTDAEWRVEGMELGQVTIVAQVISINSQSTSCLYWLDDGSGRIEARHWWDSSSQEDVEKWAGVSENVYVRVTGSLKSFSSKRYLNITQIRPIKDAHELYFHILEAMTVNLVLERGMPNLAGGTGESGPSGASAYTTQLTSGGNNVLSVEQQIIQVILNHPQRNEGVHIAAIARTIGGDPHAINAAIEKLLEEGAVYSTLDESHFNVTQG